MSSSSGAGDAEDALSRLASGNSALQSLLRRLESGLEDLLPNSSGRAKMKELLIGLKEVGNEGRQMEALVELCEVLSMGHEDVLLGFSVDSFLPVLVDILKMEHNPEMMLLSSRAITHLLEVLPKVSPKVAASGAVRIFCQRLQTIEFIDVAEQSLMAMHKLSAEHADVLQREGGLAASLMYIDFFDMNTQRTAAATAANICRNVLPDCLGGVVEVAPNLSQLLSSPDQRIVDSACLAFARLVESFAGNDMALQALVGRETLHRMVGLVSSCGRQERGFAVGSATLTCVVKTLATACRCSAALAVELLEAGGLGMVHGLISRPEDARGAGGGVASAGPASRPLDQLLHALSLANELLPPLSPSARLVALVKAVGGGTEAEQDLFGKQGADAVLLQQFAASHGQMVLEYGLLLLPVFVDISVTIVNDAIRVKCVAAVTKLVGSVGAGDLAGLVEGSPLLGYLAGYLASSASPAVVGLSLILTDMLLEKLPALALRCTREGVTYEVKRLCGREAVVPSAASDALEAFAHQLYEARFGPGPGADLTAECDAVLKRAEETAARLARGEEGGLEELREMLVGPDALSSFQLVTSGLAEGLLDFLCGGDAGRVGAFVRVFGLEQRRLGRSDGGSGAGALRALVGKLNEAVSVREAFPVVLSDASGDLTAGLKLLAQPMKLRLAREPGETALSDYSANVVLIEPLATLKAVQDFLWAKVCHPAPDAPAAHTPGLAEAAAAVAAAAAAAAAAVAGGDKSGLAGGGEDGGGHEWGAHGGDWGDSQSGGEDGVMEGDEVDDGDDDQGDVPPADITRPTPSRPHGHRAAGGDAGACEARDGLQPAQQLVFSVNGRQLAHKAPIIQAVGAWSFGGGGAGAADASGGGKAAWEQVHTVTYRLARPDEDAADPAGASSGAAGGGRAGSSGGRGGGAGEECAGEEGGGMAEQLQRRIGAALAMEDPAASGEMRLTLRLLRALSILAQDWFLVAPPACSGPEAAAEAGQDRRPLVARADFVNAKLASKLVRQLQDPVMLCTGCMPRWVAEVVEGCPFLFPLEARELYTAVTAFGVSRALHAMQRLHANAADSAAGDVRIGRIQREKIRVSRARILSSAMRAMELYAAHRSILEVEYYGEAGTGLGPTLEFFTLVAQELQAARLGMWRDTEARSGGPGGGNDGLGQAPVVRGRVRGFHRVAVARCQACLGVHFLRCEAHCTLWTRRGPDGRAACHACAEEPPAGGPAGAPHAPPAAARSAGGAPDEAGADQPAEGGGACRRLERPGGGAVGGACELCGGTGCVGEEWWMLSEEEAGYALSAFPPGKDAIDHAVLQCPHCNSVNFPGTEQALVLYEEGRMLSLSGKVMREQSYREVTRHASAACANSALRTLPVRLALAECAAVARMVGTSPEAEEGGDDAGPTRWLDPPDAHDAPAARYVWAPAGLFPAPYPPEAVPGRVVECFRLLGRVMGKALLDQRPLDLPLSPAMFKWMVGQPLSLHDVAHVDPALHATLCKLQVVSGPDARLDGCPLADLALPWTLPGSDDVELVAGGRELVVDGGNAGAYVEAVWRTLLHRAVAPQLAALRAGFDEVFCMGHLGVLTGEELEGRMRGDCGAWDAESLRAAVRADHGYKDGSPQLAWLIAVMADMERGERRLLLRFLTGSPTLPSGGLGRLQPPLTVVRKEAEAPLRPDDYLPSVMTCANYLKLPEYSSAAVLRQRLFTAMTEGQLSFLLS